MARRELDYRVVPLPPLWPGKATPSWQRTRPPFKAVTWTQVLVGLEREVRMRSGRSVEIALDIEPRHLRQDGMLRADARPRSSSVIVSFTTAADRLQFPCDRFGNWVDNVEAIARSLEDLRRVDRYGVMQGRQYAGFKALPAPTQVAMSVEQAARLIESLTDSVTGEVLGHVEAARPLVRRAIALVHPDAGGTHEDFILVQEAKRLLAAHFAPSSL